MRALAVRKRPRHFSQWSGNHNVIYTKIPIGIKVYVLPKVQWDSICRYYKNKARILDKIKKLV